MQSGLLPWRKACRTSALCDTKWQCTLPTPAEIVLWAPFDVLYMEFEVVPCTVQYMYMYIWYTSSVIDMYMHVLLSAPDFAWLQE